jgi:hypothetical protein
MDLRKMSQRHIFYSAERQRLQSDAEDDVGKVMGNENELT